MQMNSLNQFTTRKTNITQSPSPRIPIPRSHIRRTNSEVQLSEEIAAAEFRELCMFQRISISRIRRNQQLLSTISPLRFTGNLTGGKLSIEFDYNQRKNCGLENLVLALPSSSYIQKSLESASEKFREKLKVGNYLPVESDENNNDNDDDWGLWYEHESTKASSGSAEYCYGILVVEPNHAKEDEIFMIEL